jgi:hypothetical protein
MQASSNDLVFALPTGYIEQRNGEVIILAPATTNECLLDDVPFEQLFHSLHPPGWTPDGGQALTRALLGTWRFTAHVGLQQLTFKAGGRYERDLGSSTHIGESERTSASATGGRFTIQDGELTLTPDHRPASPDRYYVRVYEEWFQGRVIQYCWVDP